MTDTLHRIEIDEQVEGNDYGFAAFCDCGWSAGSWSHSDAMPSFDHANPGSDTARVEAFNEAEHFGHLHIEDTREETS